MNTKSNQRYQETDKKIQQVFLQLLQEKDLSHTTVQDICKGYVAVGGQTAIGRGIFSGPSEGFLDKESRKRGQQELLYLIDGKEAERCAMQI